MEPNGDPSSESTPAQSAQPLCPHCYQPVDVPESADPVLVCPHCGTQFFRPAAEGEAQESDEAESEEQQAESELSAARIRQLSILGRTAYRSRSYLIVGTLACLGVAMQLGRYLHDVVHDAHGWSVGAFGILFFVLLSLVGAKHFGTRAIATQREIDANIRARKEEELEASRHEPDLSTLSDGSQHAQRLEQLAGKTEEARSEETRGG